MAWTGTPGSGNLTMDGSLLFSADNTQDIGASAATRPRNIFVGTGLVASYATGSKTTNSFNWGGNVGLYLSSGIHFDGDGGNAGFFFQVDGVTKWQITSAAHFLAGVDNTHDIGASGATRPRDLYLGTSVRIGSSPASVGDVRVTNDVGFKEIADPAAPAVNEVRLYAKDNGAGKTLLVARFNTGAVQTVATEP